MVKTACYKETGSAQASRETASVDTEAYGRSANWQAAALLPFFPEPVPGGPVHLCPKCDRKTRPRKLPLVIYLEGPVFLSLNMTCRFCPHCDLIIDHQDEMEAQLVGAFLERDPGMIGKDYLPRQGATTVNGQVIWP